MEIYKVIFKDKQSITVQADCVTEAITEAKYVLESQGITPAKVDSVWSLVYMNQEISISIMSDIILTKQDIERLVSACQEPSIEIPKDLSREERRDFLMKYKATLDENLLYRGKSGGTYIDAKGKTTEEIIDILDDLSLKFQNNDFKNAKVWLLEHNYPLDLIKRIIDFNIVDLANLMFEAENNLYGKENRDL